MDELRSDRPKLAALDTLLASGLVIEAGVLGGKTKADVTIRPAANDDASAIDSGPKPGDRMPDGTVCAGISPDTGRPIYTTPEDAPLTYTFGRAERNTRKLDAHGHQDWRVPTRGELNVLFNNRTAIGGLDTGGSYHTGWYWSSTTDNLDQLTWVQRLSDGRTDWGARGVENSLRCVRG